MKKKVLSIAFLPALAFALTLSLALPSVAVAAMAVYTPPTANTRLNNIKTFDAPFETVWEGVVKFVTDYNLSVINHDERSGFISTKSIEYSRAMDCGSYELKSHRIALKPLEVYHTIVAQPILGGGTTVSVEVRATGNWNVVVERMVREDFIADEEYMVKKGIEPRVCRSKGALERYMLRKLAYHVEGEISASERVSFVKSQDWPSSIKRAIFEKKVVGGMNSEHVEYAWGPPLKKTSLKADLGSGVQWIYYDREVVLIDGEVVRWKWYH